MTERWTLLLVLFLTASTGCAGPRRIPRRDVERWINRKNNELVAYEDIIAELEYENAQLRAKQSATETNRSDSADPGDLKIELEPEGDAASSPQPPAEIAFNEDPNASFVRVVPSSGQATPLSEHAPDRPAALVTRGGAPADLLPITHLDLEVRPLQDSLSRLPGTSPPGLKVIVQPLDAAQNVLAVAGQLTIVVLDPQHRKRIARWEYAASQTRQWIRETPDSPGIHVPLQGSDQWLRERPLDLFVRYVTTDGRRFEAQRPLQPSFVPAKTSRWSNRSRERAATDNAIQPASAMAASDVQLHKDHLPEWSPRR